MANKIAIIGGGASALMLASFYNKNDELYIFEKNSKLGKKILSTGNGRCNLANVHMNKHSYNTNINSFLNRFTTNDVLNYFGKIGLEYYTDEEGRVYPISNSATSVLDVLTKNLNNRKNVHYLFNKKLIDIQENDSGYLLFFEDGTRDVFNKVVIACGNESNLQVFSKLGISVNGFRPSLCSLTTNSNKNVAGIRLDGVEVSCKVDNDTFKEVGEILFKENAISGIVVFNLSCFLSRKNINNIDFFIDFLPKISQNDLFLKLCQRRGNLKEYKCKDFLNGMFVGAVADMLLSKSHINYDDCVKNISDKKLEELAFNIKNNKFFMLGYEKNNQVFTGGVSLFDLDNNLQSKKCRGLYFVGEAVDVDGMCGGYNLLWAWISGMVVAEAI